MSPVLVTGASGYLGTRLVADLLSSGVAVRATLRSLDAGVESELRAAIRRGGADDAGLELAVASLTDDAGWTQALAGVEEVYHLASPMIQTEDADEVVRPARDGALRVLRAARDAGARRVVLTSSFAAVGYTPKPIRDYTEDDWTDPATPELPSYPLSKAVAERAAWDFIEREGGGTELAVINPTWIAGPTLTSRARSSLQVFTAMLGGHMRATPRQRFGVADVRDVADAHRAAMAAPGAAGKRYLVLADGPTMTFLDVARTLRRELGPAAELAPTEEMPGDELPPLVIHNDRARAELGLRPRPVDQTIVETALSLQELGLLDPR